MSKYNINDDVRPAIITNPLYGTGTPVLDMNDFPYLTEAANNAAEEDVPEDNTVAMADMPNDYTDVIQDNAFIGEIPFETILEGITNQFNDYINLEDKTNYVEAFYSQIHASYAAIDDEEEHPEEYKEVLDNILSQFVSKMAQLLEQRLCITLSDIEAEDYDMDELEYEFTALYEFFILNAKENFRRVIVKDMCKTLKTTIEDDKEFYNTIRENLRYYSPLVISMGPLEFLRIAGGTDVREMYMDGRVNGNFLKRYSPKLYQNEEFEVELIADITMQMQTREDIAKAINK